MLVCGQLSRGPSDEPMDVRTRGPHVLRGPTRVPMPSAPDGTAYPSSVPRLVHLAAVSRRKAIERSGIRAEASTVVGAGNVASEVARAVYAMPVVPDFSVTYQWVRELRRFHGERMIAVHFVVPSDEPVLVGRYNRPHETLPLDEAVRRVLASPMGNEIILTRGVRAKEIVGVREITQLVGWTQVPEPGGAFDCLCAACVAGGTPDLVRRLRAAYERHILAARRGATPDDVRRSLANLETDRKSVV